MKRLVFFGFIACVGLILAPVLANSGPAGPPNGLDVNVVNPLPLPVTGNVGSSGTPIQLFLLGAWQEGSFNLQESSLYPISYTIPEGFSTLLIKYVSCRVITEPGQQVQIYLESQFQFPDGGGISGNLIEMIPDNEIDGALPQARQVAHANVHAYLGISTPGGPTIGDTITLHAQKDGTTGVGSVRCVVSGELQE